MKANEKHFDRLTLIFFNHFNHVICGRIFHVDSADLIDRAATICLNTFKICLNKVIEIRKIRVKKTYCPFDFVAKNNSH